VAADWLSSRGSVKRRTRESDESNWRNYVRPRFGNWPVAAITAAEVSAWVGGLVDRGLSPATATRALATLRSILAFAVADGRIHHNVAAAVRRPTSGRIRREGQALTLDEVHALTAACVGPYRDVVPVLALAGLRWGELVGLQVGDRVTAPGPGLRLSRAVLASEGGGALYVDTLKNNRARTVPLVAELVPIVDRWSVGKQPNDWLFDAPKGGPLRESNWKRSVGWRTAKATAGVPGVRVHDLRHTAASLRLAAGADPKVVQRVLGHATAAMTMDLYGHLVDASLWQAARLIGAPRGHLSYLRSPFEQKTSPAGMRKVLTSWAFVVEPPIGIEPMTYALREACDHTIQPLPAQTARRIALHALIPLGFRGHSFHDPFHAACTRSASRPDIASRPGSWPCSLVGDPVS